jgi:enoyl-CoA hydratase/carnithine racemase
VRYETIRYEVSENILTIMLNRPDRLNAFTAVMMAELIDAFDRADTDDNVRVVIMTGAGRAFCAGADLGRGGDTFSRNTGSSDAASTVERDGGGRVSMRI